MRKKSSIWLFVVLVIGIPVLAYTGYQFFENRFMKLPIYGRETEEGGRKIPHRISDFMMTSQDGNSYGSEDWGGKTVVVDFFFTSCGTICPKMTASLKEVQAAFDEGEILINSFSVDPERDQPERLRWYAQRFRINTGNWKLITGDKRSIYALARNSFMIVATDGDGGPNDFIHSEKLVLVDKDRRIRGYYDGTSESDTRKLIADIKKLNHEK